MVNGRYPTIVGVDFPGTHNQSYHGHPGHRTPVVPLEGGIGAHIHASKSQSQVP